MSQMVRLIREAEIASHLVFRNRLALAGDSVCETGYPRSLAGFRADGRQPLPWDDFLLARHQGTSPQITDERWTYDKKCGVSLSYVPFPRSLLPLGLVKEGEQLGIDLVFQGRAHAVRPAGNDLELGAFHKLGGR